MKINILIILFFICNVGFGQISQSNNAFRQYLSKSNSIENFVVKGNLEKLKSQQKNENYTFLYGYNSIAVIKCSFSTITNLLNKKIINYVEFIPANNKPMNDTMLVKNKILPVKQGQSPLLAAYNGSGVVIGIIDTGCDFNHPDFKTSSGNTRINYLWDQTITSATTSPLPYGYGQEWTSAQINASLCTHSDLAHYGHGTHVTGIAAGNGLANGTHYGISSEADIIVVALDFNKNGTIIADAANYIFNKAALLGKPCVINASVGNYYGSHDGTDLEAQLIDNMIGPTKPGKVIVAAAGNAGNIKYHTKTTVNGIDTNFTWIQNSSSSLNYWLHADTLQIKNVFINVGVNRLNYSNIGNTGFKPYNYALNTQKIDTIKNSSNDRIGIVKSFASINTFGVYELSLEITADTLNQFWRIDSKGVGQHNSWNFDFVSSGLPTNTVYPKINYYVMPDTFQTIVSGFQCLDNVITVGNYNNLKYYYDVNNTLQTSAETANALAANSSVGPTRNNKIKPDVSATGNNVFSAIALGMQNNLITTAPQVVAQGSFHVIGGGTSAASPVVAGLVGLILDKDGTLTAPLVKSAIINCTYTDNFTGAVPNNSWGYGKLDGKAAFLCSNVVTSLNNKSVKNVTIFPNPFFKEISIKGLNEFSTIILYDLLGNKLFETSTNLETYTLTNLNITSGVYFLKINSETFKLIKN
ncbi:MAG: S8 family peptidase [Bacteroidetes bacterium]|nr:S8 family peptidase [Bacteroidota bacterium]